MGKATRDPLIYVRQINPPRIPKPRYVFDDAAKDRMQAAIDATIPVREDTMGKPMAVQDFGDSVTPTGVVRTLGAPITPPPLTLQTSPFGKTPPPEAPLQHQQPAKAAVQRFANPDTDPTPDTLLQDLAMEDVGEGEDVTGQVATEVTEEIEGIDPDAILKRFKGTPEEIAKQIAKSYGASEKRMRQLEAEKQLLLKGQPANTAGGAASTTVANQPAPAPVNQQIVVNPFDYKKAGDTWLDAPEKHLEEFEKHVTNKNAAAVMDVFRPIYIEQLNQKLFRKFGDVINDDNIEVIHAMARNSEGASDYERLTNAAQKYRDSLRPAQAQDHEVEDMKNAARTPSPQGRTTKGSSTRTYRESEIRTAREKLMRSGEYQKDPRHAARFERLYAEGRIKRGE
jgi:hypothetical protein